MTGSVKVGAERSAAEPAADHRSPAARGAASPLLAGNQAMQALLRGGWLRPKLELGGIDDPEEREADAVADRVMRMPDGACCASCAAGGSCEEETVHRAPDSAPTPRPSLPHAFEPQMRRLASGGAPLPPPLRAFFEPRLGRDLGAVRVHRDGEAQAAAASIRAKAFTLGQHVAFGAGHWSPDSEGGRRLLAHELAHTGQAVGTARRQPAIPEPVPPFRPAPGQLGRETSRTTRAGARRIEVGISRTISCGNVLDVDLVFDPDDECKIETGRSVEFVNPAAAALRLPAAEFEALAARFFAAADSYLDSWFAIRITGSDATCAAPCRDVTMPIRVRLRRQPGGYRITLASGSGRAHTQLLRASDSTGTLRHEAGHVALGISDEYKEEGVACREGEHVEERDYSLMASHDAYGRRAMLHPRHFSHIVHWFETEYPSCRIELVELKQSRPIDFDLRIGMGAGGIGGVTGLSVSAGLDFGIPLDRLRNWMLTVGPHAHLLTAYGDGQSRNFYLAGLRLGLERRFTPSAGGPFLGGFLEAGYGSFGLSDWRRGIEERESGAYGLVGARAGWGFATTPHVPSLALEGALGSPIGAPGRIGEPGGGFAPTAREPFWQLGLSAAWRF
jgi:hypothetical protein